MKVEILHPDKRNKRTGNDHDRALLRYLKIMYWMGYLPINWTNPDQPDTQDVFFEVSFLKSAVIFLWNLLESSIIIPYLYFWHRINMSKDFDMSKLLSPSYYVTVFGSSTSAVCQLIFVISPISFCWIFVKLGMYIKNH